MYSPRYSVDLRDANGLLVRRLGYYTDFVEAQNAVDALKKLQPFQKPGYKFKVKIH